VRIAYFDCVSGISGNMALGAFLDAGAKLKTLRHTVDILGLAENAQIRVGRRTKLKIKSTHVVVEVIKSPAWSTIGSIERLINRADLDEGVRERSLLAFRLLANAEAEAHKVRVEQVRLHETGALDAVIDVVGTFALAEELGVTAFYASALPLCQGVTLSDHGEIPLPAPATIRILKAVGAPTYHQDGDAELVTPTGAAILGACATFDTPDVEPELEGFGAGTTDLDWPNVLRVVVGEGAPAGMLRPAARVPAAPIAVSEPALVTIATPATNTGRSLPALVPAPPAGTKPRSFTPAQLEGGLEEETLMVLETNIDDMAPDLLAELPDRMLGGGALEAFITPIVMKKGRSAHLVTVICEPGEAPAMATRLIRETSTLGVRVREERRYVAGRRIERMQSSLGAVNVKLKIVGGDIVDATPEYDDVLALAAAAGVPLHDAHRRVLTEARSHYLDR
jgi:uncharacterized protein (TIGR00299 family) protein